MKCEKCKVNIESKFLYSIQKNQCPACGNSIMSPIKLASFVRLKELLDSQFKNIDADAIASLVIANFDITQSFKEDLCESSKEGIIERQAKSVEIEENEEKELSEPVVHNGFMLKEIDRSDAKKMLQKMRDEALAGAIYDYDGDDLADTAEMLTSDDPGKQEYKMQLKKKLSREKMTSGGGSFSRSGQ